MKLKKDKDVQGFAVVSNVEIVQIESDGISVEFDLEDLVCRGPKSLVAIVDTYNYLDKDHRSKLILRFGSDDTALELGKCFCRKWSHEMQNKERGC